MPALAITGTIGSGKSSILQSLKKNFDAEIYSADEENALLLDSDAEVRSLIISQFGESAYQQDGKPDRKQLFNIITKDSEAKVALERILHPRLEKIWKPKAEYYYSQPTQYFIAEIPLLFENGLELFFNKGIVIGCSESIRQERLFRHRSLTESEISAWRQIQESQIKKIHKADFLLWNDGSHARLEQQIHLLVSLIYQS